MAFTFNADEVFEMAERIEINGGQFYRRAAKIADREDAKALMLKLAAMEDEHQKRFQEMRVEAAKTAKYEWTFDPENQAVLYLKAFADGNVFDPKSDVHKDIKGTEKFEDIIRTAIGFEKDSIVFFLGMRDLVPMSFGKDKIDELIKQEQGHIVILTDALKTFKTRA